MHTNSNLSTRSRSLQLLVAMTVFAATAFAPQVSAQKIISINAPGAGTEPVAIYNLGHYPGGTWAESRDINNFGVAVGFGDVPPDGYTNPIGVPLFGPNSRKWFDLGTLGGERSDREVMCMGIADTGMIVGHTAIAGNAVIHAFAWTPTSGMVDIGTLADPDNFSLAYEVNRTGTLIVGWSSTEWMGPSSLPVVWNPKVVWTSGGPTVTWNIQRLDTEGFYTATSWYATAVNNLGQIIGSATNSDGIEISVLWNPDPIRGWKILQLPVTPDYPNAFPSDINDRGEIVGLVAASDWSTAFPALWKPVRGQKDAYNLTQLTSLTGSQQGWAEASGINASGDIVGDSYDAAGNDLAALWSTKDPSFVQVLGFPGTWSFAQKVNDNRIALGAYGSDTITEDMAAVQIR
ncbi:MAG: hypothetical protein ACLPY1_07210 [Terracidiphilus sp.]